MFRSMYCYIHFIGHTFVTQRWLLWCVVQPVILNSQINDDALEHIGTHCKQLITLNVYGCKVSSLETVCVISIDVMYMNNVYLVYIDVYVHAMNSDIHVATDLYDFV